MTIPVEVTQKESIQAPPPPEKDRDAGQLVDHWRQLGLFNPLTFAEQVHVVGAGAIGSHIVDTFACLGISNITVYDHDKVEGHNIPNQVYAVKHIGMPKVEALKAHIKDKSGYEIKTVESKIEKIENLSGYLVLCVDSMEARKSISQASARKNRNVVGLLEIRMSIGHGEVYFIDPRNEDHFRKWYKTLSKDEECEESPCTLRAVSTTAKLLSSLAAHRLVLAHNKATDIDLFNYCMLYSNGLTLKYDWNKN